jgi:uncharacterized membrane protein YkoI
MQLSRTIRKGAVTVAALGALGLGGSALAGAADSNRTTTTAAAGATSGSGAQGRQPDPTRAGGHVGANGKTEQALSGDVAAKVKAAAEAKVPGGTVLRVETDVDHGSAYEAHVRRADGTEVEVLVNSDFEVTAVETMQHP